MEKKITIALGADHRGYMLKQELLNQRFLATMEINWLDCGAYKQERSDYPIFAKEVCLTLQSKQAIYGILFCGTGVGMSIAANRFSGIYAGIAWTEEIARRNKEEDNVNVLIIPADYTDFPQTLSMVTVWLEATFKKDRYEERIKLIDAIK